MQPAIVQNTLCLNIAAATELALTFLPGMIERKKGAIFNISSLAGVAPLASAGLYSATKAYLTTFSRSLQRDLAGTGVECFTVNLGPIRTDMLSNALPGALLVRYGRWLTPPPESVAAVIYDSYLAGRHDFSAGLLGTTLFAALHLLPLWVMRPIVAKLL